MCFWKLSDHRHGSIFVSKQHSNEIWHYPVFLETCQGYKQKWWPSSYISAQWQEGRRCFQFGKAYFHAHCAISFGLHFGTCGTHQKSIYQLLINVITDVMMMNDFCTVRSNKHVFHIHFCAQFAPYICELSFCQRIYWTWELWLLILPSEYFGLNK